MNLSDVKQYLSESDTCVIATSGSDNRPEAATVGYSVDDDFKILIGTNKTTRKAAKIRDNNRVALVFGFSGSKTLQIEGSAEELDQAQNQERIDMHFERVPAAKRFAGDAGQNYYLISPTWLRFTDYTQTDPIFETEDMS